LSLLSNKCLTYDVRRAMVSGDSGAIAVEEGEDPALPGAVAYRSWRRKETWRGTRSIRAWPRSSLLERVGRATSCGWWGRR
jgi:hypothetical protein